MDGNLDDVIDDEEDEEWKAWGRKKEPQIPGNAYDDKKKTFDANAFHDFSAAKVKGPAFGFVKLRRNPNRKDADVMRLASQWERLLRSGHIKSEFQPVDIMTLWYQLDDDQEIEELMDFIIAQEEAYEFKVGDRIFRRPGDVPLSELMGRDVWEEQDKARQSVVGSESAREL